MNAQSESSTISKPYPAREGHIPVPGGVVHYRVAGPESAKDVVVFENGWTGSFPSIAWFEQAMAPRVRIVLYDRPGIGESKSTEPLTVARISEQMLALLDGLGIKQKVIVAGHSYGGLIAALHAAQAPGRIRAIVQCDPTPEFEYEGDKALKSMPRMAGAMKLVIRLTGGGYIRKAYGELPPEALQRVARSTQWLIDTTDGALPEMKLFEEIRKVIWVSEDAKRIPRLVISAIDPAMKRNFLTKLFMSEEKFRKGMANVYGTHKRQGGLNPASRWMSLPYGHVNLICCQPSAKLVAQSTLEFMQATP